MFASAPHRPLAQAGSSRRPAARLAALTLASLSIAALLALLLLAPGATADGVDPDAFAEAMEQVGTGNYRKAARSLKRIAEDEEIPGKVTLELARLYRLTGKSDKARELLEEALEEGKQPAKLKADYAAELGELLLYHGEHGPARKQLQAALAIDPGHHQALLQLGNLEETRGRRKASLAQFAKIWDAYDPNNAYTARQLTAIADGLFQLVMRSPGYDRDDTLETLVSSILPEAIKLDRFAHRARFLRGSIYLAAFQTPDAKKTFQAGLEVNPKHPLLNLGLGQTYAQRYGTLTAAPAEVKKALRVNDELLEAHEAMAQLYLADELYEQAKKHLDAALEINPKHRSVRSRLAGYHRLRGEMKDYERIKDEILRESPNYGEFYYIIAGTLEAQRQFETGAALCRKAVELDPTHWHAWIMLAGNELRIGREDKAKEALEVLRKNFFYHVQSRNYLVLLETYNEYVVKNSEHFRIRIHVDDDAKLRPLVSDFMDEAYVVLSRKYGFKVEGPLIFEMFSDHNDFAVRTIGLAGLGALGACFGKVVTMDAPRAFGRPFNWAATAWHEFAHVVTLQLSAMRVPRWFTEGLSEYEEYKRNPCWVRPMHQMLYAAYSRGQMRGIKTLNAGFSRPAYPNEVGVCYFQGGMLCRFIEETYGFEAIPKMLRLYAAGNKTPEVIKGALGLTEEEFDAKSLAWFKKNIFDRMKMLTSVTAIQLEDLKDAVDENPEDHAKRAQLAAGYFAIGKADDAELHAGRALKGDPNNATAHLVLGRLRHRQRDLGRARKHFEAAIATGREDFHAYLLLGHIYMRVDKNEGKAINAWKKAKACFPFYVGAGNPYQLLADVYKRGNNHEAWAAEMMAKCAGENTDMPTRRQLIGYFASKGDHDRVIKYGIELIEIDPYQEKGELQVIANSLVRKKRYDMAIKLLRLSIELKVKPEKHKVFTLLAECYLAKGRDAQAKAMAQEALAIKPGYEPAQRILDDLR